MGIVYIIVLILLFYLFLKKRQRYIYNPVIWMLVGWCLIFGLYYTSGITYKYEVTLETGTYFWSVFLCVLLGFSISKKVRFGFGRKEGITRIVPKVNIIPRKIYNLFATFSILGVILCLFDIVRLNSISVALHTDMVISGIGNIGILLSSIGLILWLYECMYAIQENIPLRVSSIICAFCYLFPALLLSGRQSILILVVSSVVTFAYSFSITKKYKYKRYIVIPGAIAGSLLFMYITFISSSRTIVANKIALFNYMYSSNMSLATEQMLNKLGIFRSFTLEILYYYSHELPMLQVVFDYYNGPRFWGMAQLSLLARNIPAGNGETLQTLLSKYIESMSNQAGVYSHVWRSATSSFFIDYGFIGGLIFAFFIGFIVGLYYKKCLREKTIYNYVGLSIICAGMFFMLQYSPLSEGYWIYPLFWWIALPFIQKLLIKKKI